MPAITNIPGLPVATSVSGAAKLWAVINGIDVSVTAAQIAALSGGSGGGGFGNLTPVNGVLIANGTSQPLVVDPGLTGNVLTSNGPGIPPTYQQAPSGTVSGGGTGLNNVPAGDLLAGNGVNPMVLVTPGTVGQVLTSNGPGLPPSMQNAASSSGTVPQGGTGQSTLTAHGVLIGAGVSPVNVTSAGTTGQVLTSNGASADPTFQTLSTSTVPGGGTGQTTLFNHGLLVGQGTAAIASVSPGTAGQVLVSNGASADPTFQALPTIAVGSGGTGLTSLTNHGVVIGQSTAAVNVTSAGVAGQALISNGASADPTFQTIPVPNVDVPHGGTGAATLTNHGVLIGQGTAAVHITSAGTAGFVLTSNGASSDPTFQLNYPGAAPDMQTFLQAAADAGEFANWIWGDYTASAPIVVTVLDDRNDIGCDFHGANIFRNFTDTATDVLTYSMPATATFAAQIQGLQIRNVTIYGITSGTNNAQNCLTISCPSHNNGIFMVELSMVTAVACARSGIRFYGAVFEADISHCCARGCVFAGLELTNPPQGSGGVISSVNIWGGDLRVNGPFTNTSGFGYGLALTADIAFQEPAGVHVNATNFIGNCSSGILAPSGIATVFGCHFENNCSNNNSETNGAIKVYGGGGGNLLYCDAAHSNNGNGQTYLLQAVGGGVNHSVFNIIGSYSFDEDTGTGEATASVSGNGTILTDGMQTTAQFIGGGGWVLRIDATVDFVL